MEEFKFRFDINITGHTNIIGCTTLHVAAALGYTDCMTILLNSGAEVNAKNNNRGDNISYSSLSSLSILN